DGRYGGIPRVFHQEVSRPIVVSMCVPFSFCPVHLISAEYPFRLRLVAFHIRGYLIVLLVEDGFSPFIFGYFFQNGTLFHIFHQDVWVFTLPQNEGDRCNKKKKGRDYAVHHVSVGGWLILIC